MQYVLEDVTSHGVRLGKMLFGGGGGQRSIETPLCLLYTRVGVVPHLTSDMLGGVANRPQASLLTLPTLYELPGAEVLAQYKQGIHRFLNVKDHFLYLSVQDPHAPPRPGYNAEKSTSLWTNGGRKMVTVGDHLKLVEAFRPNAFECLCDSSSSIGNKPKRVRKSVDRTLRFLDETVEARASSKALQGCGLLGAIEGSDLLEERKRSAAETALRPVDGFVLEGLDLEHSCDLLGAVIRTTTELLPADKPRFIHGIGAPVEIFTAVESGVDVFDGSYPYSVSEQGCALTFLHQLSAQWKMEGEGDREEEEGEGGGVPQSCVISLKEDKYAMDFSPVLRGCECYTCQYHTRAYIHHLLATKEILASILLMIHNLSHYLAFFTNLRHAAKTSTYAQFKQACLSPVIQTPS